MALRFPRGHVLFERSVTNGLQSSAAKPGNVFSSLKSFQQFLIDFNW